MTAPRRIPFAAAAAAAGLFFALGIGAGIGMRVRRDPSRVSAPERTMIAAIAELGNDSKTAAAPTVPKPLAPRSDAPPTLVDRLRRVRTFLVERARATKKDAQEMEFDLARSDGWRIATAATAGE